MMAEINFSEGILNSLDSFFAGGKSPHAMLIDGGGYEEREALSKLAARMIVCSNKERTPCGECENCRKAKENVHPDIINIRKPEDKKHFVKADVKKMVADAYLTPNESAIKVYILSEMQMMNDESQNLLLKILEEPPVYTAFILTSEAANAVIGTVLSRVVRLRLGKSAKAEYSEKAVNIVKDFTSAVMSSYEYDRIQALSPMDGNKVLTAEVLDLLCMVLRDAVSLKSGGGILLEGFSEESKKLSEGRSLKNLLDMYESVDRLLRSLENNPNYTLLCAVLCANLK